TLDVGGEPTPPPGRPRWPRPAPAGATRRSRARAAGSGSVARPVGRRAAVRRRRARARTVSRPSLPPTHRPRPGARPRRTDVSSLSRRRGRRPLPGRPRLARAGARPGPEVDRPAEGGVTGPTPVGRNRPRSAVYESVRRPAHGLG